MSGLLVRVRVKIHLATSDLLSQPPLKLSIATVYDTLSNCTLWVYSHLHNTRHATSDSDFFHPIEKPITVHIDTTATCDKRHRNLRRDTIAHCSKKSLSREGGEVKVQMTITFLIIDGFSKSKKFLTPCIIRWM